MEACARRSRSPRAGTKPPVFALLGLARSSPGNVLDMLRKVLWNGLFAIFGAAATIAARQAATRIWRLATGEEPPMRTKPKKR